MDSFDRIKEERKRLGLNQEEFAGIGGVKLNAQSNYEKGTRKPDLTYLERISEYGVDVLYIITGHKSDFTSDELEMVSVFRAASFENKTQAFQVLKGQAPNPAQTQNIDGINHNITGTGNITQK